jgi:hypothetical protein
VHSMHAATSKVVNSAQGSSCKLKFVHGLRNKLGRIQNTSFSTQLTNRHSKLVYCLDKTFQLSAVHFSSLLGPFVSYE